MFDRLLCERGTILHHHIQILQELADTTDKEGTTPGIIGTTVGALGVAAAVGTLIFWGASLAVAVVVVVVAVLRIIATINNNIHTRTMVEKKVETVFKEHSTYIEEIERCVKFIGSNVKCLKKYNPSMLKWVSVTRVVQVAEDVVGAIGPLSQSSGLIQGFRLGMDISFIKHDSEQLKKRSETKFVRQQMRMLAKQMHGNLDELMKFKKVMESADM